MHFPTLLCLAFPRRNGPWSVPVQATAFIFNVIVLHFLSLGRLSCLSRLGYRLIVSRVWYCSRLLIRHCLHFLSSRPGSYAPFIGFPSLDFLILLGSFFMTDAVDLLKLQVCCFILASMTTFLPIFVICLLKFSSKFHFTSRSHRNLFEDFWVNWSFL